MVIYLDTIKLFCYLFLGALVSISFWNTNEILFQRYFKKEVSSIDPVLFLFTGICGSSGLFFLSPILHILPVPFHSFLKLLCTAFPDWDILFYIWAHAWFSAVEWKVLQDIEWKIFVHRSWLFSSSIIPISLILISYFLPKPLYSYLAATRKIRNRLNSIFIVGAGLSVGVSAHLIGDVLWRFIPRGDVDFSIYRWSQKNSLLWMIAHIFLGFFVPFLFVWLRNRKLKTENMWS